MSNIQLAMVALDVQDVRRSIDFYRLLGLPVPDPIAERPVDLCRMDSGVTLLLVEGFASTDPTWVRPERNHYQQALEFVVDDEAAVDAMWHKLTTAGHHGRRAPREVAPGVYAALIDDPDGNVLLISSDQSARPDAPAEGRLTGQA
jgi:predicted lactoylglutathione lyase